MSNVKIYTIHDVKASVYKVPFYARTHQEAMRMFHSVFLNDETDIAKFPEDFFLQFIGEFDEVSGTLMCEDQPLVVCRAIEFVKKD